MTTQAPAPAASVQPQLDPPKQHMTRWLFVFAVGLGAIAAAMYYSGAFQHKPKIAMVTANQGPFWDQIIKGANDGGAAGNAEVRIIRGGGDEASQTQAIKGLIGQGYNGVGVSPNDPIAQARGLGGKNPSAQFEAILSCETVQNGARAVVNLATDPVDATPDGDAEIRQQLHGIPSPCMAPIVFVASPTGSWFAVSGF